SATRLSKTVIIGAAIFLLLAIAAVVYFFRRLRTTEKEAEEEWGTTGRKLFEVESPAVKSAPEPEAVAHTEPEPAPPETVPTSEEFAPKEPARTIALVS